jgi:hypothetical protein
MLGELVGVNFTMSSESRRNLIDRAVEAIDDGVDLGPQAGRDDNGLLNIGVREKGTENLPELIFGDGDSL